MPIFRSIVSVLVGSAIALGILGTVGLYNTNFAHAELEASDILEDETQTKTGLSDAVITETIGGLIRVALGLLGVVTIATILLGGFLWMTASGNAAQLSNGKKTMASGFIGLAVIIFSYGVATFIISALTETTN